MSDTTPVSSTVEYAGHTIDFASLPEISIQSLLRKGLAHFLGNEQASKVTEFKDKMIAAGTPASADELAQFKAERIKEAVEALRSGSVGIRASRPRGTALETIMREMATKEVKDLLKSQGLSFPTGDKKVRFESGAELSGAELVSRRLANETHANRIRKDAEKELAARERKVKQMVGDGQASLEDLIG